MYLFLNCVNCASISSTRKWIWLRAGTKIWNRRGKSDIILFCSVGGRPMTFFLFPNKWLKLRFVFLECAKVNIKSINKMTTLFLHKNIGLIKTRNKTIYFWATFSILDDSTVEKDLLIIWNIFLFYLFLESYIRIKVSFYDKINRECIGKYTWHWTLDS